MQAGGDSREGENFQIVGVRPDSQMGGGGQGFFCIVSCWQKEVGVRLGKFHGEEGSALSAKTQIEAKR